MITVEEFAETLEADTRVAVLDAIEALRRSVDLEAVEEAIRARSPTGVLLALRVNRLPEMLAPLKDVIMDAVRGGGEIAAAELAGATRLDQKRLAMAIKQVRPDLPKLELGIKFDILDPNALRYVQEYSGRLIVEVSQQTQHGIRALIESEFTEGISPQQQARRIRDRIGLTTQQERFAQNYERTLRSAVSGEVNPATGNPWTVGDVNERYTLSPIRGAGGLVEARVDSAVATYRQRLLNMRADTIARTETLEAAHAGQEEHWRQLQSRGAIPPNAEREWKTRLDELTCPICAGLNGERAKIGGTYPGGFNRPPAHPNCRCTEALTIRPKKKPAAGPAPAPFVPEIVQEVVEEVVEDLTTAEGYVDAFVGEDDIGSIRAAIANPAGADLLNARAARASLVNSRAVFVRNGAIERTAGKQYRHFTTQQAADAMAERVDTAIHRWVGSSSTEGGAAIKESVRRRTSVTPTYHNGYIDHDAAAHAQLQLESRVFVQHGALLDEMRFEDFDAVFDDSAQYARAVLRRATGKETVTVYRGTSKNAWQKGGGPSAVRTGDEARWGLNAAESWTMDRETAESFANAVRARGGTGMVLEAEVPLDRVQAAWVTDGNLFMEEMEVIVGGDPIPVTVRTVKSPTS